MQHLRQVLQREPFWLLESTKIVFDRGSAPDPAGGAHDAPSDPLVGWGGRYPFSTPLGARFLRPFGASLPAPLRLILFSSDLRVLE